MVDQEACHFNFQCALCCAQVLFSFVMMLFCMLMVGFRNGALEVYLPLLSSVAAVWLPTPSPPRRITNDRVGTVGKVHQPSTS